MNMMKSTDLTEKQAAFVQAYIALGDAAEAYRASFPDAGPASIGPASSRLLRTPKIQAAIREQTDDRIKTFVPRALKTLTDIAGNPQHKDASANAKHVLALAGYQPHQVIEVHKIDTATKIKAITAMIATLSGLGMKIDLSTLLPPSLLSIGQPKDITPPIEDFIGT